MDHQKQILNIYKKINTICIILTYFISTSCLSTSPLSEKSLRIKPPNSQSKAGISIRYLGNSTIHITDGTTNLLVDGFLSRPSKRSILFGHIYPNPQIIEKHLNAAKIKSVDAVLVGHTHADHALDAPEISKMMNAKVMGTESYANIHKSYGANENLLINVKEEGNVKSFGKFTVTFLKSKHIAPNFFTQILDGKISNTIRLPAKFTDFKCGETYAIHISHPHGNIAVTTSAGAESGQWKKHKADILFLAVGLLSKKHPSVTDEYWKNAVIDLQPRLVVASHWDDFTLQFDTPQKSGFKLTSIPVIIDRPLKTIKRLQTLSNDKIDIRVMDAMESINLPLVTKQ